MKSNDVLAVLEKVAPVALSDEFCKKFKMYDNSGIIIDCGEEITGILFSLDLTYKAVEHARSLGYNMIVTHHPAIYGGISRFDCVSDPQAKALAECMKYGISVISMHLNFDCAPEGIDFWLMRGLGGDKCETAAEVEGGAYGRVYDVAPATLKEFARKVASEFGTDRLCVYGNPERIIRRAASFCGAGCDDFNMAFAESRKADVFVSSDMKHHEILNLVNRGLAVIVMTHYASENYGLNKIFCKIKEGLKADSSFFTDEELL